VSSRSLKTCPVTARPHSALLAMRTAVIATDRMSVHLSIRLPVCPSVRPARYGVLFRRMKIRSCSLQHQEGHCSFWRGKVYPDIHWGSPPAMALKCMMNCILVGSENFTNNQPYRKWSKIGSRIGLWVWAID